MSNLLQDKQSIMHVFSAIIANPEILGNDREYPLVPDDFPEPFHKVIFGAMHNLYMQGAEKLSVVEIDGILSKYAKPYHIFNINNGVEYLEHVEKLGAPENFELHYNRLRKYSFLRACQTEGIDISELFDVDTIDTDESEEQQKRFDTMSLDEMVIFIEGKMIGLRDKFLFDNNNSGGRMGDIAKDILEEVLKGSSYGAPLASKLYTAATLGAQRGKLHMVSAPSGVGKSRWNLRNAVLLSVPVLYDLETQEWYKNPTTGEGVLYTGTELMDEEFTLPVLANIAQVDETRIKEGRITADEAERLKIATKILENSPLFYEKLLDFDLADIEHAISKHVNKHNVAYVIHDYVHDSVRLMASFNKINKQGMREDQRLLQVMTRLKELAQQFDVFIMTSTQLNSNHKLEGALDETAIAGAKSMVNKVDIGAIMAKLSTADEKVLAGIKQSHGELPVDPNITINIFKSRGTKWTMIRLWVHFDHGKLNINDIFVTDYKGRLITELKPVDVLMDEMEEVEYDELPFADTPQPKVDEVSEEDFHEPDVMEDIPEEFAFS